MPTPGNPKRTTRMDEDSWGAFEAACKHAGVHPATMLRTLAEWYYRKPGVTVRRPPPVAAWKGRQAKGDHDTDS